MIYQKANYFWHSDSLVQAHPLAVLDPDGARLPAGRRQHRVPVHARGVGIAAAGAAGRRSIRWSPSTRSAHSRDRVQKGILSDKTLKELPPVKQRMFRDNPINGRRALYIGAHAGHIVDWPEAIGKALLFELIVARRAAGIPLSPCLARGRRHRVGQPRRPAPRHLLRRREAQAPHAAHDDRRRRADRSAIGDAGHHHRRRPAPDQSRVAQDGMPAGWPRRLPWPPSPSACRCRCSPIR